LRGKRFVVPAACLLALLAGGCADPQADREIADKVHQEIDSSPVLGGTQIDVAARDGVVTLSGVVDSQEQAGRAEKLAWSVEGVEAVDSRLEVRGEGEPPPVGTAPPREDEPR
jgi:hypothetical protein